LYNAELFCGQYFIYSLQLSEFLLYEARQALKDSAGVSKEAWFKSLQKRLDDMWKSKLKADDENSFKRSILSPSSGTHYFSSDKLALQMGKNGGKKLRDEFLLLPNTTEKLYQYPGLVSLLKSDRGYVGQPEFVRNMSKVVHYAVHTSNFFNDRNILYYVFFQWHHMPYEYLRHIKDLDLIAKDDFDNMVSITGQLRDIRLSPPLLSSTFDLINRYFDLYGRIISDKEVVAALIAFRKTKKDGKKHDIREIEEKLIKDLIQTLRCFYSFLPPENTDSDICQSNTKLTLYEYPQYGSSTEDNWDVSMQELLRQDYYHTLITNKILDTIHELVGEDFKRADWALLVSKLNAANIYDTGRFESDIWHYGECLSSITVETDGSDLVLPYKKIIDSTSDRLLESWQFIFEDTGEELNFDERMAFFNEEIEELRQGVQTSANKAGYFLSEEKICVTHIENTQRDGLPVYRMKLRHIDYYIGVAVRNLFKQTLIPSQDNIRSRVIPLLLRLGCLTQFVDDDEATALQQHFTLTEKCDSVSPELIDAIRNAVISLYKGLVRPEETDNPSPFDVNTASFAGCGLFILTGDRIGGVRYPMLLLEKRWKVSEKTNDLCYPSAGSCDYFNSVVYKNPNQYKRLYEDDVAFDKYKQYIPREANPFETARRELYEELFISAKLDDIRLISFGIDEDRLLQQFSFLYETDETAEEILARAVYAVTLEEGKTFAIPFSSRVIRLILKNFVLEPGAAYSLQRLMVLRKNLIWENIGHQENTVTRGNG
jgi:hypothetical protein